MLELRPITYIRNPFGLKKRKSVGVSIKWRNEHGLDQR